MEARKTYFGNSARYRLFKAAKYIVYVLLSFNIYLFLQEELLALSFTYADDIEPGQLIQAFSATIDTAAWVILLLMFELETAVLNDRDIHGPVKWGLHGLRGLCSIALVYAFTGYYQELVTLYDVSPLSVADVCTLVGGDYSRLVEFDEYETLTAAGCAAMGEQVYTVANFNIVVDSETLRSAQILAWVDVVNALAWILVVIVLEVEVRLQLRGDLSDQVMNATKIIKLIIYAMLFICAGYWGYDGDFLDFWDACLWLFAFIFIELNVFEWQFETDQVQPVSA
ncbi:MAG: hypothetical protein H6985_03170 [Pseudomonadales bacterium]|nr:hypothetical protein [Pseudomonadales bacterium]